MRATLEYIKRKFNEYNNLMLEGKLKPLPFKLSNAKSLIRQPKKNKKATNGFSSTSSVFHA